MGSLVCGFNGFRQLSPLYIDMMLWTDVGFRGKIQGFSWNTALIEKDGVWYLAGYIGYDDGVYQELIPPTKSPVVSATLNDRFVLAINERKECWKFKTNTNDWTKIQDGSMKEGIIKAVTSCEMSLFLTENGKLFRWSDEIAIPEKVVDVACGSEHGVVLTESGSVYTFGSNSRGQLGSGDLEEHIEPVRLTILDGFGKAVSISAGNWHSCLISSTGDLYCWGSNSSGQLALPSTADDQSKGVAVLAEPTLVDFPLPVVKSACGSEHTIILSNDGKVWGCGKNNWKQLGIYEAEPGKMNLLYNGRADFTVSSIDAGMWNSLIVLSPSLNT